MQISENTDFGLRVAVMRLQRDENAPAFTLYPMIHLGERRLYETVRDEFRSHDLLICEGASGRAVRRLAQVYLQAARNRRSDLVLQNSVLGIRDLAIPYRIADLPAEEFDRLWAKVPFWERWAMELGALAYGLLWRYYGGSFAMRKLTPVEDRQEGFFRGTTPCMRSGTPSSWPRSTRRSRKGHGASPCSMEHITCAPSSAA